MRAAKLDATQAPIVAALEARGHQVLSMASIGNGAPDILVGARRRTTRFINGVPVPDCDRVLLCMEIKSVRNLKGELYALTPLEQQFHRKWKQFEVYVVGSVEEAIRIAEGK